jgi:putative nucleotidyltransferase with HDIG domain
MNEKRDHFADMIREAVRQTAPMPAMCREVMNQINAVDVDYGRLAEKMRLDPGVTMNVLKLANSSFFGGKHPVDSLRQAFVRLGTRRLFQIVLAQSVADRLAVRLDGYELEPHALLRHSLCVALTAETLAKKTGQEDSETLFTAGLLHDMGKVPMDPFLTAAKPMLRHRLQNCDWPFDRIEEELFGLSHSEAGKLLMEEWRFPPQLTDVIATHHHPHLSVGRNRAALMLHWADTLAYSEGFGDGIDGFRYAVSDSAAEQLDLRPRDIEYIASETLEKLTEMEEILTGTAHV